MTLIFKKLRLKKTALIILAVVFLLFGLQLNGVFVKKTEASHTENKSTLTSSSDSSFITLGSAVGATDRIRDGNDTTSFGVSCNSVDDSGCSLQYRASIGLIAVNISRIELKHGAPSTGNFTFTIYYRTGGVWTAVHGPFTRSGDRNDWIDVNLSNVTGIRVEIIANAAPNVGIFTHSIQEFRALGVAPHRLIVTNTANPSAFGIITSSPSGINCSSQSSINCLYWFNGGTTVNLTAVLNAFSSFAGWGGSCAPFGTSLNCSLLMTSDLNVSGLFVLQNRTLNINKPGDGTGAVMASPGSTCDPICSASYTYNTSVNLFYSAGANSTFTGWSGDCAGTGTCTVTMNTNRNVNAQFMADRALAVTKSGNTINGITAGGTVSDIIFGQIDCGAVCSSLYSYNSAVTLTAMPDAVSQFDGWQGAGCTGTGNCAVTMSVARSVTARFSLAPQTLIVTPTGLGGGTITSSPAGIDCGPTTFDCSFDFSFGTNVALTATPDVDSQFVQWSGDCAGVGSGGSNPGTCSVVLDQPRDVIAEFQSRITNTSNPDLSGWAWSSTIGWLNFNCADKGVCGTSDYRVEMNPVTGILNGWAWSPSIGWVEFNAAGPYPDNPQTCMNIDINTGVATGWARVLSYQNAQIIGFDNQNQQQGFALNENSEAEPQISGGGFNSLINFFKNILSQNFNLISSGRVLAQTTGFGDGWLKITNAERKNNKLIGWAWGGEPIGWLNFFDVSMPSLTCSFASDKKNVAPNETVNLTWACDFPVSCSLNEGIGVVDPISGMVTHDPTKNVTIYQLTCTGLGATQSWNVEVKTSKSPRREIRPR